MRISRKIGKAAIVATATSALLVSGISSANAAVGIMAGGGAVTTTGSSGQHLYAATLTADVSPAGLGVVAVTWNCQATATPDAVSTTISGCEVGGRGAAPTTLPGAVSATAGSAIFAAGSTVEACVSGFSSFAETLLGNQTVYGTRKCASLVLTGL